MKPVSSLISETSPFIEIPLGRLFSSRTVALWPYVLTLQIGVCHEAKLIAR
jgi:hypothetical protein